MLKKSSVSFIYYFFYRFMVIFICLSLSVLSTLEEKYDNYDAALFYIEICVVVWFSIEYILRLVHLFVINYFVNKIYFHTQNLCIVSDIKCVNQ